MLLVISPRQTVFESSLKTLANVVYRLIPAQPYLSNKNIIRKATQKATSLKCGCLDPLMAFGSESTILTLHLFVVLSTFDLARKMKT